MKERRSKVGEMEGRKDRGKEKTKEKVTRKSEGEKMAVI